MAANDRSRPPYDLRTYPENGRSIRSSEAHAGHDIERTVVDGGRDLTSGYYGSTYLVKKIIPHQQDAPDTKIRPLAILIRQYWIYEVVSCIVSLCCFSALVIVLHSSAKQQPTRFFHDSLNLTLNGLVALLSTLMEISMMVSVSAAISQDKWNVFLRRPPRNKKLNKLQIFDEASRGPVGSLQLLVSQPRTLASLGAIVTIFALSLATFSQLLSVTEYKTVLQTIPFDTNGTSGILRSDSLRSFPVGDYSDHSAQAYHIDLLGRTAIYDGIMEGSTASGLQPNCNTGNCTWPVTPSIGIKGACTDFTNTLQTKCGNVTIPVTDFAEDTLDTYVHGNFCMYHFPNGEQQELTFNTSTYHSDAGLIFGNGSSAIKSSSLNQAYPPYDDLSKLYLQRFIISRLDNETDEVKSHNCALWATIDLYNVSIQNGNYEETIVHSFDGVQYSNVYQENSYYFINIDLDISAQQIFPNVSDGHDQNWNVQDVRFSPWSIDRRYWSALVDQIKVSISAHAELGSRSQNDESDADPDVSDPYNDTRYEMVYSNDIARKLYEEVSDPQIWINQFASRLTDYIRQKNSLSDKNPHPIDYSGTSSRTQPYIRVRWPWIAFPGSLVASSIALLISSIVRTRRRNVLPWKNSLMPAIYASVDCDIPIDKEQSMFCAGPRATLECNGGFPIFHLDRPKNDEIGRIYYNRLSAHVPPRSPTADEDHHRLGIGLQDMSGASMRDHSKGNNIAVKLVAECDVAEGTPGTAAGDRSSRSFKPWFTTWKRMLRSGTQYDSVSST